MEIHDAAVWVLGLKTEIWAVVGWFLIPLIEI